METAAAEKTFNRWIDRREIITLIVLVGLALGVRLYFLQFYRVISADGVGYATAARELLKGETSILAFYPPVYPALLALAHMVIPDIELAGRLVAIVMGSLLVVPLYLLGREFFNKKTAILACALVIAWPSLRNWSTEVMTQSTYITLLLTGIYLLWLGFQNKRRLHASLGGVAMALAYLTRPEALLVFAPLLAVLLWSVRREWRLNHGLVLSAVFGFLLFFVPYFFFLHKTTGSWQLAGKTGVTLGDALAPYLGRPDLKNEPGFAGIGILDIIRRYPGFLVYNIPKNLVEMVKTMVPWFLWILAIIGFFIGGFSKEKWLQRFYLLATFVPLLVIVSFFFVGPEYLQPYLPILFLWAGHAAVALTQPLKTLRVAGRSFPIYQMLLIVVAAYAIYLLVLQVPAHAGQPYHFSHDGARYDHKRIGLLLQQHLPPNSRIMTRWGRISFYAGMEWVNIPQADFDEIIASAKTSGVRFLVVDGTLANVRPQLAPLIQPVFAGPQQMLYLGKDSGPMLLPGIRLYLLSRDPSSVGVAVYELVG